MANEYNFKPITEAEYLEEVPEGATVLVESGGEIKRVPGDGLGGASGGTFWIKLIQTSASGGLKLACEFSDIVTAVTSGCAVYLENTYGDVGQLTGTYKENGEFSSFSFLTLGLFGGDTPLLSVTCYTILSDGTVESESVDIS